MNEDTISGVILTFLLGLLVIVILAVFIGVAYVVTDSHLWAVLLGPVFVIFTYFTGKLIMGDMK